MFLLLLPTALFVFLFVLLSPVVSEPTSPNDPFRAIVLQVPKVPEPPICCLKPLTPLEPVDDEVLLSFEEWKTRQTALQANNEAKAREGTNRSSLGSNNNANSDNGSDPMSSLQDASPSLNPSKAEETAPELRVEVSPHFRVPLTDRFNYASLDCSARVHTSHRSAKSASSILSSKRDRYMLSPCNSKEKQFVAVELCDDIRIDTVQLANFEFFSGVFKDFSVSVAKTYSTDVDGWTHVGSYKAKNVRGVQSFHPPTSLSDFYRYIRIDFESHYGNEYFCPVSLLRVYGLTHLEQWKWDIWEAESRVKQEELQKDRKFTLSSNGLAVDHIPTTETVQIPVSPNNSINNVQTDSGMDGHLTVDKFPSHTGISSSLPSIAVPESQTEPAVTLSSMETALSATSYSNDPTLHTPDSPSTEVDVPSPSSNVNILSSVVNQSQAYNVSMTSSASHSPHQSSYDSAIPNNTNTSTVVPSHSSPLPNFSGSTMVAGPSSPSVAVAQAAPSAAPPTTRGVESIYSTIMNRLTAIESNHTLYSRYIDQQNSVIREVLKRLGEDVGRLEGIVSITMIRSCEE
jgi:Sad1 / UNC-like C-terminal